MEELVRRVGQRLDRALELERITTARTADGRRMWKLMLRDPENNRYFLVKEPVVGDDPFADAVVDLLVAAATRDFERGRSQAR